MVVKTAHPYIIKDTDICGGEPIIESTRIPVRVIFNIYEETLNIEEILEAYPHLTSSKIHDALSFAYDNIDEIRDLIDKTKTS